MSPAPALFLFPPDAPAEETGDLAAAAAAAGLTVTRVGSVEELLSALGGEGAAGWKLVLVSLRSDGVDRGLLARVRGVVPEGTRVAVSAPGLTLDRVILAREAGSAPLVLEPLGPASLLRFGEPDAGYPPTRSLGDVERDHIARVLRHTGGVMGDAARILGIHRNTLTRKVDQYGLREEPG